MEKERLAEHLERYHSGASNAATSRELECAFGIKGKELRDAVNALRREGVPIASNGSGYFYAATEQEVRATIAHLTHRIGGIAAGVVLLVIFLVLRFTSVKIPIGPFFLVTSILMAVLVVIFAGGGIHALIEGDLIDGHYLSSVPTNDWIGLYPYVECLAAQAIAAIAVLALFAVGFARKRKLRTPDNRK